MSVVTPEYRQLPETVRSWLEETGSLTRRLRSVYPETFNVRLLKEVRAHAWPDEIGLLGSDRAFHFIREVVLQSNDEPLVLARTVIPAETLMTARKKLTRLGTRPLGEVLFSYRDLAILDRQYSRTTSQDWIDEKAKGLKGISTIWGRRTVYLIHGHPLLVAEFFLEPVFGL